jgi:hypothetical protein
MSRIIIVQPFTAKGVPVRRRSGGPFGRRLTVVAMVKNCVTGRVVHHSRGFRTPAETINSKKPVKTTACKVAVRPRLQSSK